MVDMSNTFQECWKNWVRHPFGQPDTSEHAWINELNQAVFSRLEKILPPNLKVRTVSLPSFICHTEAAGGYGVDSHAQRVSSHRIRLPKDASFEERVDAAVGQLHEIMRGAGTVFFYTPVVPICEEDLNGGVNRHMMAIRLFKTGETVDVGDR